MDQNKAKSIFCFSDELHDDIDEIYELLMDGDDDEAVSKIDKTRAKLAHFKSNIVIKDEV